MDSPWGTNRRYKMRRIIDEELLQMIDQQVPQQDIAKHFDVTPAAVSLRLKRLRQLTARPAVLDRLTQKEQKFAMAIAEGKSQTQSAMESFDVTSRESA